RFDPAFREYIRRWAFKHPTPADFFRTMNDGLGEDLDWFWRSWFYTTGSLDQAIDSVRVVTDSTGARTSRIYLANLGPLVMPVDMALLLDVGSRRTLDLPVEIWFYGSRYTAIVPGPAAVTSVVIDPDTGFVDLDRTNNQWPRPIP
ncbi:MAG: M1 family peptidase, partial [Gemmatimonadales bacterium]